MFVNPLTAFGMYSIVKNSGAQAFIQNAAGGQVAHFLNILASKQGVDVINLVRKDETMHKLKETGCRYVLNITDSEFMLKLKVLINELKPLIFFDAVAGEQSGPVFNLMPRDSSIYIYGALSGQPLENFDPMGIIFKNKAIYGFNLNDYIPSLKKEEFNRITNEIQDLFISGDFSTGIQSAFPLKEVVKAIRTYIKSMSSGKILLVP
jgi:NADPH:quinone reductase-like Zn-dependent oxidoreductase